MIIDPQRWFDYRDKRNISPRTYDQTKAREVFGVLPNFTADGTDLLTRLKARHI